MVFSDEWRDNTFLVEASNGDRKIHWMRCDLMTRAKKEGGLGFRELESFNVTLLGKMASRA